MAGSPRFRHLDDLPVAGGPPPAARRPHRVGLGEVARVLDRYLTVYARCDPGMIVQPHGHNSDHVVFVIEGDIMCGERHCPAGTHIALDQGDTFGPFVAGPERVRALRDHDGRPAVVPRPIRRRTRSSSPTRAWCRSRTRRSTCPTRCPTRATDMSERADLPLRRGRVARADRARHRPRAAAEAGRQGAARRLPRAGRRRLLHPGRAAAARDSRRRRTATTTPRCSWCSRAAASSTASRWRASTSPWSRPTSRTGSPPVPTGSSFLVVRQGAASFAVARLVTRTTSSCAAAIVVDGTGLPRRRVDVGVLDGTIAALARLDDDDARRGRSTPTA